MNAPFIGVDGTERAKRRVHAARMLGFHERLAGRISAVPACWSTAERRAYDEGCRLAEHRRYQAAIRRPRKDAGGRGGIPLIVVSAAKQK